MPTCYAPGCTSGYKSNTQKRHFFAPPSDPELLSKWKRAIPRADKELSKTCKVCDLHFDEADISKTFKHIINGEVVEIDRAYWALKEGAVPVNFPNLPSYLSRKQTRRRSPKKRAAASTHDVTTNKAHLPTERREQLTNQEAPVPLQCTDFAQIVENSATVRLPANWTTAVLEEEPGQRRQIVFYVAGMKAGAYTILKSVVVRDDITYVVHANGRLLRQSSFDVEIRSLQDLEALLQIVHNKQFCLGCSCSDVATQSRGESWKHIVPQGLLSFDGRRQRCLQYVRHFD